MLVTWTGTRREVSLQERKAEAPMLVTESGSVREVRRKQLWNANGSTTVNLSGNLREVSPSQ